MDQLSAHLDRGWDLISKGDLGGALLSAKELLDLDTNLPEAHNMLGFIRAAQGDAEDALEHYRQAIDLDDSYIEAKLNAAEVLIHPLHDFDEALDLVDDVLDVAQESDEVADAVLLRVEAFIHQGQADEAKRAVALLPNGPFQNPKLYFLVGRAKFETGYLEQAKRLLEQALAEQPECPDSLYYLGLFHKKQDQADEALVYFLKSRELEQGSEKPPWSIPAELFEQRVRRALLNTDEETKPFVKNKLIVVSELPGPESVATGMDPRISLHIDEHAVYVYQRNLERNFQELSLLEDEVLSLLHEAVNNLSPTSQE
ncbi:MAG: tetratricopeptide repeat protein [Myxococcales bacterium]|nr:MAG: tetratricopeptide repeat protein [Myxococcales bacterium]